MRLRMGRYDLSSKAEKLWSIRSGGASRDRLGAADTLLSERNELYIFNRCEPLRYRTAVLCLLARLIMANSVHIRCTAPTCGAYWSSRCQLSGACR